MSLISTHRQPFVTQRWQKWSDCCSTSGGQSRIHALIAGFWCLIKVRSCGWIRLFSAKSAPVIGDLVSLAPSEPVISPDCKSFFYQTIVVILDWSRLISIISSDTYKFIDLSRNKMMTWIFVFFIFSFFFIFFRFFFAFYLFPFFSNSSLIVLMVRSINWKYKKLSD